jgi:hypothetical protein
MAFFTFLLNWLGGIARLGTVLVESDDFAFQFQFIVAVVLNTIIISQFALYWNVAKKVDVSSIKKSSKNKLE